MADGYQIGDVVLIPILPWAECVETRLGRIEEIEAGFHAHLTVKMIGTDLTIGFLAEQLEPASAVDRLGELARE